MAATQPAVLHLDDAQLHHLKIETVREQCIPILLSAHGRVQLNEDKTALILAPVAGQVVNLRAKVGDAVKQGGVLFSINSREIAASIDEYLEGRKDLELAEKTYAMTKELFEHKAASNIALQQAENDLAKARTKVARVSEQLRILDVNGDGVYQSGELNPRIPIKAPLSGTVLERHLNEHQFVQGDSTALMTIADLSTVWVVADVFERDLRLIQVGQKAEVSTLAYPDESFEARVALISSVVDPVTRTVKVRFLVSNSQQRLKPEMFANVRLFISESERAVTLPPKAVFTEGGQHFVFVARGGGEFANQLVQVAPLCDKRIRVLSGLSPGQKVVTEGALLLRGAQSGAGDDPD